VDSEPVNHGWLCDKGRYGIEWIVGDSRVVHPRVRAAGTLTETSWPDALDAAASGLRRVIDGDGPEAIALLGGARSTNEGAYAFARLAKGVIGTDHVDAQPGDGLSPELMLGAERATIADCDRAAGIVLLGPDLKEELPVLYLRIRRAAVDLGVPLVEIGTRETGLTRYADAVVRVVPGEEPHAVDRLLHALGGAADDGRSGTDPGLADACRRIRDRGGDLVVALGRTSLATAADVLEEAAAKLVARPGTRVLSTLRRANVHGALELGLAPGLLPGRVTLAAGGERFSTTWRSVPEARGLDTAGILRATLAGDIKGMILVGTDLLSSFPDAELARTALTAADFVVAVGACADDAAALADVVLPAALWGETSGTTTNLEGRVLRLGQKVAPAGTAMADWRIASELAAYLGAGFDFESVEEIQDEIARLAPSFAGVDARMIRRARDGVVVPLADHADEVVTGGAPAVVNELSWNPIPAGSLEDSAELAEESGDVDEPAVATSAMLPTAEPLAYVPGIEPVAVPGPDRYALRLVVGRTLYDAGRVTAGTPLLASLAPGATLFVNAKDRDRIGVDDGDTVRVRSGRASLTLPVAADRGTPEGVAFLAFEQPGRTDAGAAELIDAGATVTDLRVETIS